MTTSREMEIEQQQRLVSGLLACVSYLRHDEPLPSHHAAFLDGLGCKPTVADVAHRRASELARLTELETANSLSRTTRRAP